MRVYVLVLGLVAALAGCGGADAAGWHCGRAAGPCCDRDACDPGLTCMGRDSGMAAHTCFTADTTKCGGAGQPCCAVVEMDSNDIPSWCLAGLGCGTDGTCS